MKKLIHLLCLKYLFLATPTYANTVDYQAEIDSLQELLLDATWEEEILWKLELSKIYGIENKWDECGKYAKEALAKSEEREDEYLLGRAKLKVANWHRNIGDSEGGQIIAEEALTHFRSVKNELWEGKTLY